MNLRFTSTVLALIFSIDSAGAREVGDEILGSDFADIHADNSGVVGNEKANNRRLANRISTSLFDHGVSSRRRFYHADVGILQGTHSRHRFGNNLMNDRGQRNDASAIKLDNVQRFLEVAEDPYCGTNGTCLPSACECISNVDNMSDHCTSVFNSVCNGYTDANGKEWGIEGCFADYPGYPRYQLYYKTLYCELAQCIVDGGTEVSCYCQLSHTMCEKFGALKYDAGAFCTYDACCQSKSDDAGMASCFESTNSTPTTSPTTSTNNNSSSSALSTNSAGAMSLLVTTAAVLSLGCDAM